VLLAGVCPQAARDVRTLHRASPDRKKGKEAFRCKGDVEWGSVAPQLETAQQAEFEWSTR